MNFIYYSTSAINGYDAFGHYLRAALLVNTCSNYTTTAISGCTANFRAPEEDDEGEVASAAGGDEVLERTANVLRGEPAATPTPTPTRETDESPAESAQTGLLDYLLGSDGG
jgi:hypothetical protein